MSKKQGEGSPTFKYLKYPEIFRNIPTWIQMNSPMNSGMPTAEPAAFDAVSMSPDVSMSQTLAAPSQWLMSPKTSLQPMILNCFEYFHIYLVK